MGELIVNKEVRRQGLGRRLIEEVVRRCPGTRLDLVSEQDGFYESLGFAPIGRGLRLRR